MALLPTMNVNRRKSANSRPGAPATRDVLSQEMFRRTIAIERKRTERSNEPFLLLLLESGHHHGPGMMEVPLQRIASALGSSIRDTDEIGWFEERATLGVMFTCLHNQEKNSVISTILNKVSSILSDHLLMNQLSNLSISFYFFPDDWDRYDDGRPTGPALYPDMLGPENKDQPTVLIKRLMDIAGSALLLLLLSPLIGLIGIAVKCSSKGPIFFRQQRVGQYGKRFTFLKFRSMLSDNDHSAHKEFVTNFIADKAQHQAVNHKGEGIYKLTSDSRVTAVGKLLRRTSLDELPQLINVLRGEMSLVGPRPPLPYEVAVYQTWHRSRVLKVKPGITGLWQVTGRSRVRFDEMVRLDLRYATCWTPWLDLKILLCTPMAVIRGTGAV